MKSAILPWMTRNVTRVPSFYHLAAVPRAISSKVGIKMRERSLRLLEVPLFEGAEFSMA